MRPISKSLLHASGFVGLLVVLYFLVSPLDLPQKMGGLLGRYGHQILLDVGIAITLAVSLNLILGIAGQFSIGHAGFAAAGAFTCILVAGNYFEGMLRFLTMGPLHLSTAAGFSIIMVVGMAAGAAVAAVLGLLVGLPTLRLRGDYLAIATLGFGEILTVIFQNFRWNNEAVFGASTGLSLSGMRIEWVANQPDVNATLPAAVSAYQDLPGYAVGAFPVFAVALLAIYVVRNIKYATSGRALLAIREDGIASESVGVPTTRYKVAAFVIGAALAGLAGGLISHHKPLINPEGFRFMRSIEIVAMVILGGQGSLTGSILAAILLTVIPELLRSYVPESIMSANTVEKWRMVFYSLFIILAMLFRPQGLFGRFEITDLGKWLWRKMGRGGKEDSGASAPLAASRTATPESNREMAMGPLLLVEHATMQFGGLKAVDDFSLTLDAGELVGLIGPNGAGKTTVFNMLTGVYCPTSGNVSVATRKGMRSIRRLKPHSISRLGVARTFQNIRLFGNLSVLENVQIAQHARHKVGIPASILRTPAFYREEAKSRAEAMEFLGLFNLADCAGERANSLSYGDQRRLEIARALATKPRVLLLDEPAAGMNPTEKRELMEMIRSLRTRFGLTILLIEHDMKVIMGVCQRIMVLDYGKTIAMGTPEEIRRHPAVIEAYLGTGAKVEAPIPPVDAPRVGN